MTPERLRGTGWMHERPTLDVVVLILTIVVALVIVLTVAIVGVLEVMDPRTDTDDVAALIDSHIGTILGALLGLIAGQAAGRREGAAAVYATTPPDRGASP